MANFVVTFTPYLKKSVFRELARVDDSVSVAKKISDGILLIQSEKEESDFLNELLKINPTFIKHICPAKPVGKIKENLEDDKQIILDLLLAEGFDVLDGEKFAVQTRVIAGGTKEEPLPYSSKDIEVFVGTYFSQKGGKATFSDRAIVNRTNVKIFSIIVNDDMVYVGQSTSEQNLNFSCDEYRTSTKHGKREISRAENKLKEALSKYDIDLGDKGGVALDIGAAPGGWTKVLVDHGFDVVAVDPGDLHPDLQNHPKIQHHKCRIENLNFENYFDIIVNDMNVDPNITSEIMNSLAPSLKDGGIAIVTFKLPNNPEKGLIEGVEIVSECYDVVSINSLFHNRQEVTALIKKNNWLKTRLLLNRDSYKY